MNKENIDICYIQETHLQKDKTFKVRGYQWFRTDRGGDRRKGDIITLMKSNINAYMSSSSNDGAEQHIVTVKILKTEILLVNYYCPNNVNLALHNIHVRDSNFFIMGDFNSQSRSWGYDHIDARGEEIEAWQDDNNLTLINQPTLYSDFIFQILAHYQYTSHRTMYRRCTHHHYERRFCLCRTIYWEQCSIKANQC